MSDVSIQQITRTDDIELLVLEINMRLRMIQSAMEQGVDENNVDPDYEEQQRSFAKQFFLMGA